MVKRISRNRRSRRTTALHFSFSLAHECLTVEARALNSPAPTHQCVPSENSALSPPFPTEDRERPTNHTSPTLSQKDSRLPETFLISKQHNKIDDKHECLDVHYECNDVREKNNGHHEIDYASERQDDERSTDSNDIPFNQEALGNIEVLEEYILEVQDREDASISAAISDQEIITLTEVERIPSTADKQPSRTSSDSSHRGICSSRDINRAQALFKSLLRRFKPANFTGTITLYGKASYTIEAYEHLVAITKDYETLPLPTNMRHVVFPFLTKTCFATSVKVVCPSKQVMINSFKESLVGTSQSREGEIITRNKRNEAVVMYPSTWARLDICSYHELCQIVCLERCRCIATPGTEGIRIESTYRVLSTNMWKSQPSSLWFSPNGTPLQATVGSRLSLLTFSDTDIPSFIRQGYKINWSTKVHRGQNCKTFRADVFCTFMAHQSSSLGVHFQECLNTSEMEASTALFLEWCMSYIICKPNFVSTHRSTNTSSESKSAGDELQRTSRKRKRPSEIDFEDDERDFTINPGDLVTFFMPVESCNDRFMIVYNNLFWPSRLESDEQLIRFLYIQDKGDVDPYAVPSFGVPSFVSYCKRQNQHKGEGTHEKRCHTTGKLSSREIFFMYRVPQKKLEMY